MSQAVFAEKSAEKAAKAKPAGKAASSNLRIGEPDDSFEREADWLADQIMDDKRPQLDWSISRMSIAPPLQRKCACGGSGGASGQCEDCKEKEEEGDDSTKTLQRKAAGPADNGVAPPIVHEVLNSSGEPLDLETRKFFEPRFGHDFGKVRVHSGARAAESAKAVNAAAYVVGSDMVFANRMFEPHTSSGRWLIAHELSHIAQQRNSDPAYKWGKVELSGSGEAAAQRAAYMVAQGRAAGFLGHASKTSLQRFEGPLPEIPEVGPEIEIEPEIEPEIETEELPEGGGADVEETPESEEAPDAEEEPDTEEAPETGESPQTEGTPETTPEPEPGPLPMPKPGDSDDKDKDKDPCASKQLPPTHVTWHTGPLGQAGTVTASPLTRCPGNTKGSMADTGVYPKQFKCIKDKGLSRKWIPAHVLHGQTRRSPFRNLHGPGNEAWNIIIGHTGANRRMNAGAEEPAKRLVYDKNQVLWYEARVDSYVPGNEYFTQSMSVDFGLLDKNTGVRGPRLGGGKFTTTENPPNCPTSLGPMAAPPPLLSEAEADFNSTLKICLQELQSRTFPIKNGGLRVIIRAQWSPAACTVPATGFQTNYTVSLLRAGALWGFNQFGKDATVEAGKSISLIWRQLPKDDYRIRISLPSHSPSCCLQGSISVFTFDAPRHKYKGVPGEPIA